VIQLRAVYVLRFKDGGHGATHLCPLYELAASLGVVAVFLLELSATEQTLLKISA
jgi:hypothetical protein